MSKIAVVEIDYYAKLAVPVKKLPAVLELLEGTKIVDTHWSEKESRNVWFTKKPRDTPITLVEEFEILTDKELEALIDENEKIREGK